MTTTTSAASPVFVSDGSVPLTLTEERVTNYNKKRALNFVPCYSSTASSSCSVMSNADSDDNEEDIGASVNHKKHRKPSNFEAKSNYVHLVVQHNYHDHANDPVISIVPSTTTSTVPVGSSTDDGTNPVTPSNTTDDHTPPVVFSTATKTPLLLNLNRGGVAVPFPIKLHEFLLHADERGYGNIVSWQPHGRCFVVHDAVVFKALLPNHFKLSKIASFQRQLNLYGFTRLTKGNDKSGYYHERFLRGRIDLAYTIHRVKVKGTGVRGKSNPEQEPDFYSMPWVVDGSTKSSSGSLKHKNKDNKSSAAGTVKAKSEKKKVGAATPTKKKRKPCKKASAPKQGSGIDATSTTIVQLLPKPTLSLPVAPPPAASSEQQQQPKKKKPRRISSSSTATDTSATRSTTVIPSVSPETMQSVAVSGVTAISLPFDHGESLLDAPGKVPVLISPDNVRVVARVDPLRSPPAMVMVEVDAKLLHPPVLAGGDNAVDTTTTASNVACCADENQNKKRSDSTDIVLKGWGKPFHFLDSLDEDIDCVSQCDHNDSVHNLSDIPQHLQQQPLTVESRLSSLSSTLSSSAASSDMLQHLFAVQQQHIQCRPHVVPPIMTQPMLIRSSALHRQQQKSIQYASTWMMRQQQVPTLKVPSSPTSATTQLIDIYNHKHQQQHVQEHRNNDTLAHNDDHHEDHDMLILNDNEVHALLQDITDDSGEDGIDADFVELLQKVVLE